MINKPEKTTSKSSQELALDAILNHMFTKLKGVHHVIVIGKEKNDN